MDDHGLVAARFEKAIDLLNGGRSAEALTLLDQVLALAPKLEEAHNAKGNALQILNRPDEALRSFDRAIAVDPDFAEAHANKALVLHGMGRLEEALQACDRAVFLKPEFADGHNMRGIVLRAQGRPEDALANFRQAVAIQPGFAEAHYNQGLALQDLDRPDEAAESFRRAIALSPEFAEAYCDLGVALLKLGSADEARRNFDAAIALKPALPDAYWSKAVCCLLTGRFEEGWPLYEWRKRRFKANAPMPYPQPAWQGDQDLQGKTLLVRFEQGLGDTIQFCRYVALAEAMGARVILAVQDSLVGLLAGLTPTVEIIDSKTPPARFDYHASLLSLPLAFGTRLDTIPAAVPYLRAEAGRVRRWKEKIGSAGFKIGIAWQGNKQSEIDAGRSFPVNHFADLAEIPGVRLISLQKGPGTEQLSQLPAGMIVEDLGPDFDHGADAFLDTAAVMENLDLVITSDTAIAHLAGALARPVWVALRHMPDWRWLLDRPDCPWYPTMRLFRQPSRGDWRAMFDDMQQELAGRVS